MNIMTLLILFLSLNSFSSTGLDACGKYSFKGSPKIEDKNIVIVINEGTLSEFRLVVPLGEQYKITPYLKLMVEGELKISKLLNIWRGEVVNLNEVKLSVPDPLHPRNHSYLNLKKKSECL
jgi:hypothetical protein